MKTIRTFVAVLALLASGGAAADQPSAAAQPSLLVASSRMDGSYARTVLFAMPARHGHVGFVLNRPTEVRLPALKSPVFAGGPQHADTLFAFVRAPQAPGEKALQVLPGLYLAFRESDVALALDRFAARTRVFAGLVSWEAEALEEEVANGLWHVLDADLELVLEGSVDTLWSRLISRAESMTARIQSEAQRVDGSMNKRVAHVTQRARHDIAAHRAQRTVPPVNEYLTSN